MSCTGASGRSFRRASGWDGHFQALGRATVGMRSALVVVCSGTPERYYAFIAEVQRAEAGTASRRMTHREFKARNTTRSRSADQG